MKKLDAAGPFLRDIVFGVHDALLTNIGIVTGFVTALQDNRLIVVAALIDVVVSAFAMAFGTYLSRKSESAYLEGQLNKEAHEDLESVMASPVSAAIVMWVTYVVAGLIPLLPFAFDIEGTVALRYAIVLTLIVFFVVGLFKGVITKGNRWLSGLQFLGFGTIAALIGYVIGLYGQQFIG
jgi:predicted membrane protein (TIGR00267 family)